MKETQCFVQPDTFTIIDTVHPITGKSVCYGHTLEQIQARYPGAIIGDIDEWCDKREASFLTDPSEISEKQYDDMLNVLPPKRWIQARGPYGYESSFEMIEHQSGRVTSFYIAIHGRHFTYHGIAGIPHAEKIKRCIDKFQIQPLNANQAPATN